MSLNFIGQSNVVPMAKHPWRNKHPKIYWTDGQKSIWNGKSEEKWEKTSKISFHVINTKWWRHWYNQKRGGHKTELYKTVSGTIDWQCCVVCVNTNWICHKTVLLLASLWTLSNTKKYVCRYLRMQYRGCKLLKYLLIHARAHTDHFVTKSESEFEVINIMSSLLIVVILILSYRPFTVPVLHSLNSFILLEIYPEKRHPCFVKRWKTEHMNIVQQIDLDFLLNCPFRCVCMCLHMWTEDFDQKLCWSTLQGTEKVNHMKRSS